MKEREINVSFPPASSSFVLPRWDFRGEREIAGKKKNIIIIRKRSDLFFFFFFLSDCLNVFDSIFLSLNNKHT